jgi:hypothetical protein
VLSQKRITKLKAANKADTQRKLYKRKRVQKKSSLPVKDRVQLTTLKEFNARSNRKKAKKKACVKVGEPSQRRCRRCNKASYNLRICK